MSPLLAHRMVSPRVLILNRTTAAVRTWIAAVEAADGQPLEVSVLNAMVTLANYRIPLGGVFCVSGARTLAGSLVPMVGAAPTAYNFSSSDYTRKGGWKGNGADKYFDLNRNNNADGQNDKHMAIYVTTAQTPGVGAIYMGTQPAATAGSSQITADRANSFANFSVNNTSTTSRSGLDGSLGFWGSTRTTSSSIDTRVAGATLTSGTLNSNTPANSTTLLFCRNPSALFSAGGIAAYSVGPASGVNLTAFDTILSNYFNALNQVL